MQTAPVAGCVVTVADITVLIGNRRKEFQRTLKIATEFLKWLEISVIFVHPPDHLEYYAVSPVWSGKAL